MKRKPWTLEPSRLLQVAFLVLLAICAGQVVFWIVDEIGHTKKLNARLVGEYEEQIRAARRMIELGIDPMEVDRTFPNLIFSSGPEGITINPATLDALQQDRVKRAARYGWEGSFFLVVLVAAMAVIAQTLRQDVRLRRRQQNFLAAVTHEFKSPLASVKLSAETLALRDPPGPVRQRLVGRILADLSRLEDMVGNILDTARLEEGRIPLQRERVSVNATVHGVVDEMAERAREGNVTVVSALPDAFEVEADPVAVRTVLRNLVDNAIKATAAHGGGTVHVDGRVEDGAASIAVQDDGVGFAPEEGPKLFEKFYRPGNELRRTSRGSGLGLYIVKRFVQLTGGRVSAASAGPGQGATFTVRWPRPADRA